MSEPTSFPTIVHGTFPATVDTVLTSKAAAAAAKKRTKDAAAFYGTDANAIVVSCCSASVTPRGVAIPTLDPAPEPDANFLRFWMIMALDPVQIVRCFFSFFKANMGPMLIPIQN